MISDQERFRTACDRFDVVNAEDPNRRIVEGKEHPAELYYAERMTHWLDELAPDASETVRLAARCQHIARWRIPRSQYPMDRTGYHRWRTGLYDFHAEMASRILAEVGYGGETIEAVSGLLKKRDLKTNPEMQLLEDVACLVFLENYFSDLARQHDQAKIIDILRKTWKKMSPRGHKAALELRMAASDRAILDRALASP